MRYSVQRYGTWDWLDYDAPLITSGGVEWVLNSYGLLRATIPSPAARMFQIPNGRPMFEPWGTFIHCEIDDGDRTRRVWTGIVKEASLDNTGWDLQIVEFPGYFAGLPYEGLIRGIKTDPADLLRQIINDSQIWSNSWFGCTVQGTTSLKIGTDLDQKVATARAAMDSRKKTYDELSDTKNDKTSDLTDLTSTLSDEVKDARALVTSAQTNLASLVNAGAPTNEINSAKNTLTARQLTYNQALSQYNLEVAAGKIALDNAKKNKESAKTAYDKARDKYADAKKERDEKGGAYEVRGEDLKDTFRVISDLVALTGIEWYTQTVYTDGPPDVRINVGYPQVGGVKPELVFDTGVNITHPLHLTPYGDFANAGIGVGAGEGPTAVRASLNITSKQMRRPVIVEDRSLKTKSQITAALRREVNLSQAPPFPRRIEVREHPNCPIGSWNVGDIVTVRGLTVNNRKYLGKLRVVSWKWKSRFLAELELQPV